MRLAFLEKPSDSGGFILKFPVAVIRSIDLKRSQ